MPRKFTYKEVKEFIKSNSECELLSCEYVGVNEKLKLKCKCGEIFFVSLHDFKNKNRRCCRKCSMKIMGENRSLNYEYVKKFVDENSECKLLSYEYFRSSYKLKFKCKCGEVFETTFDKFKGSNKRMCNKCSMKIKHKKQSLGFDFVKKYIEKDCDYVLRSNEYVNTHSKIEILHKKCNTVFKVSFNNFMFGQRCPRCSISKGEDKILKFLEKNNIINKTQYTFKDLKGKRGGALKFDFAVFNDDNTIKTLIEYDGQLHFKKYFEKQNFEIQHEHDLIKDEYCKKNNIKLLRIPYTQFDNIEEILKATLL